jgi:hypothetical protein
MGPRVLINGIWYKSIAKFVARGERKADYDNFAVGNIDKIRILV